VGLSRQAPAALLAGAGAAGASVQGDDLLEAAAGFVGDQVTGMVVVAPVRELAAEVVEAGLTAVAGAKF
jgi:hypothetical protein